MPRVCDDWLQTYAAYTEGTETPKLIHSWCGVSALAGALRRHVWIDMLRFKWYPNFYIILVARPAVISKTTTMDLAIDLLKEVPGINFGPDEVTREGLVQEFSTHSEMFEYNGGFEPMSAITLASGELGSLINPQDRALMNTYITLWDGRKGYEKITKMSGNNSVNAPWINLIGCTTPSWIADNLPTVAVGGGFVSRCVFVYADAKEEFIALPDENPRAAGFSILRDALIADLQHIALNLVGPMTIEEPARAWIRSWYKELWTTAAQEVENDRRDGFIARKQTHLMKLAMILSVARGDSMVIELRDVQLANLMIESTQGGLEKVFAALGRSELSANTEKLVQFIRRFGKVEFHKAYQHVHAQFPDAREFEAVITGLAKSGQIKFAYTDATDLSKSVIQWIGEG